MTEQAFYELVLRCSLDALRARCERSATVLRRVETAYTGLVAPASDFEVPLRFAQAMAAIGDLLPAGSCFSSTSLTGRWRNRRPRVSEPARLKDRHWQGLTYVTATNRRLEPDLAAATRDVAEFAELFAHHTLYISLLNEAEIAEFVARFAAEEGVTFSDEDLAFIRLGPVGIPACWRQSAACSASLTGRPVREPSQDWIIHRRAAEDPGARHQRSDRVPQDLERPDASASKRRCCRSSASRGAKAARPEMESVIAKHLVSAKGPSGASSPAPLPNSSQRQHAARRPDAQRHPASIRRAAKCGSTASRSLR